MATTDIRRAAPSKDIRLLLIALLAALTLVATACRAELAVSEASRSAAPGLADGSDNDESVADGSANNDPTLSETTPAPAGAAPPAPPAELPRALTLGNIDCAVPGENGSPTGLTVQGQAMFDDYLASGAAVPTYQLAVDINPTTGQVVGVMRAQVPSQERMINFRVFAGIESFDSDLTVRDVRVNGEPVDYNLDQALLSIPASFSDEQGTLVELGFDFTIDQMAANGDIFSALSGESLQPDQVGLLGRTESGMQLGHWFPVWLPADVRSDADPSGFGDIGAFPAANICTTITVPSGYEVVTGGVRVDTTETSVVEAAMGLRDFSILISDDLALVASVVQGVEIRVWGPPADTEALMTVLDHAKESQIALTEAFGPYPWQVIDLVSAPLGAGVGGMEWPGMIWVETSIFAGGLPGLGDLGELFGDDDGFGELFGDDLLGSLGGPALTTTLEWTIAHELGHEWWHATVGNDSIASPAVDEPLAQFAACIAMQRIHPDNWRTICEAQTTQQYAQARSLGVNDTAAEQASDQFESSLQYGAVVYGKAPGFYLAAADLMGWDELIAALNSFVAENPFALVSTDALRSHLVEAAGEQGDVIGDLWDRWFRQAKGDEDIEASDIFGAFGGAGGLDIEGLDLEGLDLEGLDLGGLDLEGLDLEGLDLEGLDLEGLDLEGLDLEGLDLENLDLEAIFGEDAALFEQLLEGLLTPAE